MLQPSPRRHLQTFARVRPAAVDDVAALRGLERHTGLALEGVDWATLITGQSALVVTAHEGESLVGAAVALHRGNTATAKIIWLGVCASARGRGVGTLLLDAITSAARDRGAAVAVADAPAGTSHVATLLLSGGFQCRNNDAKLSRYKRLLWRRDGDGAVIRLSFA